MTTDNSSKQQIKKEAQDATASAKNLAKDAADTAKAQATAKGEEAKEGLAEEMHSTARALRKAADEVRDGSPQGSTFSYLASGLADMADSVEDQSMSDMVGVVNNFARRNPLAFLGGAALLGFTVSRFAKASGHHDDYGYDGGQGTAGYGTTGYGAGASAGGAGQPARPSAHSTAYNPNIPNTEVKND
jgi:hypothetical protein